MTLQNHKNKADSSNAEMVSFTLLIAALYLIASLFILNVLLFIFSGQNPEYQYGFGSAQSEVLGDKIYYGADVQQTIPIGRSVNALSLRLYITDTTNLEDARITVVGENSGKVYVDTQMNAAEFQSDGRLRFPFDEDADVSEDSSIRVSICTPLSEDDAFSFYVSQRNTLTGGNLFIDGEYQDYDLDIVACGSGMISEGEIKGTAVSTTAVAVAAGLICLFLYWLAARHFLFQADFAGIALWGLLACAAFLAERYINGDGWFVPYRFSFILGILSILLLLFRFRSAIWLRPEYLFLMVALFVGIRLTMIPYTCVVWDDEIHFCRAVQLCRSAGVQVTCADTAMSHWQYRFISRDAKNMDIVLTEMRDLWMMGRMPIDASAAEHLSPMARISYIPSAVGLVLGSVLGLPYVDTFILGKIANILVYTFVVYKAIEIVPIGKRIMLVVALFPTNLILASNYTYDAWTTGLTMLWIAMLLDEMTHLERSVSNRRLLSMLIVFVLSCSAKTIYCVLGLLFFLMPKQKAGTVKEKRKYFLAVCLVAVLLLLSFTLPFLLNTSTQDDIRGGSDVNSGKQLKFIFTHPIVYTKTLLRYLLSYLSLKSAGLYMTCLGYLGTCSHLPLLVLTAIVTVTDRDDAADQIVKPWKNRVIVYACAFATVCMISTALYLAFTPVGMDQINGCQPRYLLPLVFPCLLFASTSWAPMRIRPEKYNAYVLLASVAIMLSAEWSCYLAGF